METEECWGGSQWYNWLEMGLLGLLSCPPPPPPPPPHSPLSPPRSHSLSISYLSDLHQSAAAVSLGEGREEETERSCSFSVPSSPASQSDSIHPTLLWSAELCGASLSCSCIEHSRAEDLAGLLPDLSACMWEAQRLIPSFLINGIPITLQSH